MLYRLQSLQPIWLPILAITGILLLIACQANPTPISTATATLTPTAAAQAPNTPMPTAVPTANHTPTLTVLPESIATPTTLQSLEVDIVPHWQIGEKRVLELVKGRERREGEQPVLKGTTRTEITILVLDANTDGYVLAWTFGETRFDDPTQANNPLVRAVWNILKGLTVNMSVDSFGSITRVVNWEEMSRATEEPLRISSEALREAGVDQASIDAIVEQTRSLFSSEEQIRLFMLREVQLYFAALGWEYTLSEPIAYENLSPNPFGGEPFPSKGYFLLEEYDRATGEAVIAWRQSLDQERVTAILLETMKELTQKRGGPPPKEDELPLVTIEDASKYAIDVRSGWVQSMHHSRTIQAGDTLQIDTVSILNKTLSGG